MPESKTTDAKGGVTSITIEDSKAWVQYTRKVGRPGFSNEEASLGIPITYTKEVADNPDALEVELQAAATFVRTIVVNALGGEEAILEAETAAAAAKSKGGSSNFPRPKQASAPVGDAPEGKAALWAELLESPDKWWDNHLDKTNPKAPDFKRKGEKGERTAGLWLDSDDTPEAAKLVYSA